MISIILFVFSQAAFAQNSTIYENPNLGLNFSYPSYWSKPIEIGADKASCFEIMQCVVAWLSTMANSSVPAPSVSISALSNASWEFLHMCNCNTLMDYVNWEKQREKENSDDFLLIVDNQTSIGKKYPAWRVEYSELTGELKDERSTYVWVMTKSNDIFYQVSFSTKNNHPSELKQDLSEFENLLNSINFFPSQAQNLTNSSNIIGNKTTQYENPQIGVRLSYPTTWQEPIMGDDIPDALYLSIFDRYGANPFIAVIRENEFSDFYKNCNCDVLKTFMQEVYKQQSKSPNFSFINDNQTTVGKNYPAWQFEYSDIVKGERMNHLDVYTKVNDTLYRLMYSPGRSEAYERNLPEVRNLINSIEFNSVEKPLAKAPSFMNGTEEFTGLGIKKQESFGNSLSEESNATRAEMHEAFKVLDSDYTQKTEEENFISSPEEGESNASQIAMDKTLSLLDSCVNKTFQNANQFWIVVWIVVTMLFI